MQLGHRSTVGAPAMGGLEVGQREPSPLYQEVKKYITHEGVIEEFLSLKDMARSLMPRAGVDYTDFGFSKFPASRF